MSFHTELQGILQKDAAAPSEGVLVLPSGAEPLQTVVMTNASGNIRYNPIRLCPERAGLLQLPAVSAQEHKGHR